ncbi:J domain-containing protein [Legionella bononiensis]|uniref:DnaJ domain-containing protein n=1 Tax=Legionella bononiensis TaxID=2793102 RepID=A0ABS1W6N0_9GAMM|nr:J domain-containing protein [Legionella bononiensis]MBL7478393.1 DnaJ domain-containing protein [Legionella bononiensis]MBL7524990.1 DnaJ domain-containing protein [Legionella bononiensis]MBL7561287.1 DnaJ domain-containing protein [Legionella bononiensis]
MPTVYEILGVEPTSTFQKLKKAYYRRAIILHPDKNKGEDTTERFKELQSAWLHIDSPDKAQKYYDAYEQYPSDKKPNFNEDILRGNFADFDWNDWPSSSSSSNSSSSSSSSGPSFSAPGRDTPVFEEPTEGVRIYRDDVADLFIPLALPRKFVETLTPATFQNPALFSMIADLLNEHFMNEGSQVGVSEEEALDIINQHSQRQAHIIVRANVHFRDMLDDRISEMDMNSYTLNSKSGKYLYVFKGTKFVEDTIFSIKPVSLGSYMETIRDESIVLKMMKHWPEFYVHPISKITDLLWTPLTSKAGLIIRQNRLELAGEKVSDLIAPMDDKPSLVSSIHENSDSETHSKQSTTKETLSEQNSILGLLDEKSVKEQSELVNAQQPIEPVNQDLQIETEGHTVSETRINEVEEDLIQQKQVKQTPIIQNEYEELKVLRSNEEASDIELIDSLSKISKEYLNHLNQSKDNSELLHTKKSAVCDLILFLEDNQKLPKERLAEFHHSLEETKEIIKEHRDPIWQRFMRDCIRILSLVFSGVGFFRMATGQSPQFFKPSHGERFIEDVSEKMSHIPFNH